MKIFHTSTYLYRRLRNFHKTVLRNVAAASNFQTISYEDSRLQNYLKTLKENSLKTTVNSSGYYDHKSLKNIISLVNEIDLLSCESKELETFISELKEKKDEMVTVAQTEKEDLEEKINSLKSAVLYYLIPKEIIDDKDIIMELTPGVGGQEAMLFTKDMFDMYCNFVQMKGWTCEILKYDTTGIGGLRNGHIAVSGRSAFKILKYESGVHRIQRIPKTERAGRVHTSTMTVAVLPQPADIDIVINPKDIELEFKRSGGPGGQHVNTTDSCVRIYHKPTGLMVESQVERDQHRNRQIAMKSLRAKLYERELESMIKERTLNRKLQIGTAGRSEKIRTYNFAQDRITDHRAHIHLQGIESFFSGELLDELLNKLQEWNAVNILMEILSKYESK